MAQAIAIIIIAITALAGSLCAFMFGRTWGLRGLRRDSAEIDKQMLDLRRELDDLLADAEHAKREEIAASKGWPRT